MKCPCCGCNIENGKARSVPQHRRFFGMVRAAFHHWPESSERQFSSEEELRAWLTMKAGWRNIAARIPLIGIHPDRARMLIESAFKGAGNHAVPVIHKDELVIWVPRSIAFHKMGPQEFNQLSDAVADVIKRETGIDADEMLKQTEAAA